MNKQFTFLIVSLLILMTGIEAKAQIGVVSVSEKNDVHNFYTIMKEAFPLSFNDPASPRFIFFDKNQRFIFGIGGYVQATGVYDFNGVEDYNYFTTSSIALKGQQEGGSYGMTLGQSRLFFKLIGNTNVGRLVSYMEMEFEGPSNTPILRQAFVQFRGFLVGQTWSNFCDLAASPVTIDEEGPSSEVAIRQPQVRYTHKFNKHWQASLSMEYVVPSYTNSPTTETIRQRIPDVPLAIKYTMNNGSHLQAAGVLRNIYYKNDIADQDEIVTGWGASISGSIKLCPMTSFMFQGVCGEGIANYIQDISGIGYDLVPAVNRNGRLSSSHMWGAYGAIQQTWCDKLSSALIYSYARITDQGGMPGTSYKYAQYAGINLLWNFTEYGTTGLEYIYGRRNDFNKDYGNASRINTMVQYRF